MRRINIGLKHQNQNCSGIVANLKVYLENLQAIDNASFLNYKTESMVISGNNSKYLESNLILKCFSSLGAKD